MTNNSTSTFRRVAERLSRRIAFQRYLVVGGTRLPIRVSPAAGLRFATKPMNGVDRQLLAFAIEYVRPGMQIWDVGANLGIFSVAAAHLSGKSGAVCAFEPDTWLVELLRRSARMQPDSSAPIEIVPVAVASSVSLRKFEIANRSRATNHLAGYGTTQTGGTRESQTVPCVSLDWMLAVRGTPDVVKIDVEGAEREVLEGATTVFRDVRPVVHIEVETAQQEFVTSFFQRHGYELFDAENYSSPRLAVSKAAWNTIAVPC
jgi:FkbM family methyltransferase